MNLGLGNLATLKGQLLAAGLQASTDYDAQLAALGKGVAATFERLCNRTFGRVAAGTYETQANRDHLVLPRYPVEAITAIDLLPEGASVWEALELSTIVSTSNDSGVIIFDIEPGTWRERLRVTYTGGFFFETLEPTDSGYPTAAPSGVNVLPDDLRLAWLLQCEHVWRQRDVLGTAIASEKKPTTPPLLEAKLIPLVDDVVRAYRRLSLT